MSMAKTSQTMNKVFNEIEKRILDNSFERANIFNETVQMSNLNGMVSNLDKSSSLPEISEPS